MIQRCEKGDLRNYRRQVVQREEDSGKKKHRGHKQGIKIIE
jgi:hypothetical protein